jgi:adenylate cyclase
LPSASASIPCVVGNFGSRHRFDYSALGDTVNVAARLEVETKRFGLPVLIGPDTAAAARSLAPAPIGHIRLRGRSAVVEVFTLGRVAAQGLRVRSV